ncbi:MAG: Sau3AI family type II restriction endonuclease [Eubacteriaceae bacterium]
MNLPYNNKDPKSIEDYSKKILNKTFKELLPDDAKIYKGKGNLGQLIEKYHFKYDPNNDANPDFKEAGVELKLTPYKINKNGSYSAKERLVLNIINYMTIIQENFENSTLLHKNQLLLIIYYLYEEDLNQLDYRINFAQLFQFPKSDLRIIKDDWEKIVDTIRNGNAHTLSESDTFYLGACTKGNKNTALRKQPYSNECAPQRAFSLKSKYMTHILNTYIRKRKTTYDPIVKNTNQLTNITFEEYVLHILNSNVGKSVDDLSIEYEVKYKKNIKNFASKISLKILKVNTKNAQEFENANIKIKAIRVEQNGMIEQHMSFPTFKFTEIIEQDWENSDLRNMFIETKFLFVIFRYDKNNILRLDKGMFWNMPLIDLDTEIKKVWDRTVQVIKSGVEIIKIKSKYYNNLPTSSNSSVAHVRPHSSKRDDAYPLPDGRMLTKQCFWLNNSYIKEQIKNGGD